MKTTIACITGPWTFDVREVELPDNPPTGWIRLQVQACGVCGSDLNSAMAERCEPVPFGHEIAGIVDAVGPECHGLEPGQTVALQSGAACGACDRCKNGRSDLCRAQQGSLWGQPAMGFSTYMHAPLSHVVSYHGLSPAVASLAEPLGVSYDMVKTAGIELGERVCIVGPGPIALGAVALVRAQGASRLVCVGHSHSTARLDLAAKIGAEVVVCDTPLDEREDLKEQFDHVLVTSPTSTLVPALSLLRYGGILTYIGIGTGDRMISFDANDFHFRKLQLRASFASPALYLPAVIELLKAGVLPGEELISHTYPLNQIADAMTTARDDKACALKVIVEPQEK